MYVYTESSVSPTVPLSRHENQGQRQNCKRGPPQGRKTLKSSSRSATPSKPFGKFKIAFSFQIFPLFLQIFSALLFNLESEPAISSSALWLL